MRCSHHATAASNSAFTVSLSHTQTHTYSSTPTYSPGSVWCVGRNYVEHCKELGNAAQNASEEPMIFLKAGSSLLASGLPLLLPAWSSDVHHVNKLLSCFKHGWHVTGIPVCTHNSSLCDPLLCTTACALCYKTGNRAGDLLGI